MKYIAIALSFLAGNAISQCGQYCLADTNQDGNVTAADFSSWIALFYASDPAADINNDGSVTPADFSAWLAEYTKGSNGTCCPGPVYSLLGCDGSVIYTKNDLSSCLNLYVEYETNEYALVIRLSEEDLGMNVEFQTVNILSCVDKCPGSDGPDIQDDVESSSIVLVLTSTCQQLIPFPNSECGAHPSIFGNIDAVTEVRLYRTNPGNDDFPRWEGEMPDGFTVSVFKNNVNPFLSDYARWKLNASPGAWPNTGCNATCMTLLQDWPSGHDDPPPSVGWQTGGSHAPYQVPAVRDDCKKNPIDTQYYAVLQWVIISDYDLEEKSRFISGIVLNCE